MTSQHHGAMMLCSWLPDQCSEPNLFLVPRTEAAAHQTGATVRAPRAAPPPRGPSCRPAPSAPWRRQTSARSAPPGRRQQRRAPATAQVRGRVRVRDGIDMTVTHRRYRRQPYFDPGPGSSDGSDGSGCLAEAQYCDRRSSNGAGA